MRDIKFRGYAVDEMVNDQWQYGTGIHRTVFAEHFAKEVGQSGETFIWTESGWIQIIEGSQAQYTGLKDKNSHEIYEGDIVKYNDFNSLRTGGNAEDKIIVGKVEFSCGMWIVANNNGHYDLYEGLINDEELEVIGNAYENPELI